ncbi:sodium ion-translocating decarboxylase subunit beta [Cellulosilyticum sp. I15G10I2]|uniref:sodium ion-translocating decarboxylase subunit beta n=1 Tax=Cellulosilyticum sp. I15G10I2 TaxID=1892843 RepID=UPI00085C0072|nr:sodium ion-translocating decarboxylase subunit beta [Cellulosilyticum sp. I15G10I2]
MKKEKILQAAVYISGWITIVLSAYVLFWKRILPMLFSFFLNNASSDATAIGIIGGADGPTAIFITTKIAAEYIVEIVTLCFLVITLILFMIKYKIYDES